MFRTTFAIHISPNNSIQWWQLCAKEGRDFYLSNFRCILTANEFICLQHDMEIYIIYTAGDIYASFVTYIVSIVRNRVNAIRFLDISEYVFRKSIFFYPQRFAEKYSTNSPNQMTNSEQNPGILTKSLIYLFILSINIYVYVCVCACARMYMRARARARS